MTGPALLRRLSADYFCPRIHATRRALSASLTCGLGGITASPHAPLPPSLIFFASIAAAFGDHGVSIESMIQKGRGAEAELVLITHPTSERNFFAAIEAASKLPCCKNKPMTLRVL